MFTHCLSCKVALPEVGLLGRAIRGEHVAYDPARGRLWSVCRSCGSWNLFPMDERWELVEELERVAHRRAGPARARLLSKTPHIALLAWERLRIVRIGDTGLAEEAWWRFGRHLGDRWADRRRLTAGAAASLGAAIVGGVLSTALPARYAIRSPAEVRRWLRFGELAWTGRKRCALCGAVVAELSFFDRTIVRMRTQEDRIGPALIRRCPRCGDAHDGGLQLSGLEAEHTLRRVLDFEHHPGVSEARIRKAIDLIDREGDAAGLVRVLVRHTAQYGDLPAAALTALAVAANEDRERRLLRLEVAALERYWREAETLASIVDGELTPLTRVERLRLDAIGRL